MKETNIGDGNLEGQVEPTEPGYITRVRDYLSSELGITESEDQDHLLKILHQEALLGEAIHSGLLIEDPQTGEFKLGPTADGTEGQITNHPPSHSSGSSISNHG